MIKIVNFCGGRGGNSIIRELRQYPHVRLTNIVNAYDDGKSTGHIRRFFRMLGPSDIRKTQSVMMRETQPEDLAVRALFNFRFPETIAHADAVATIDALLDGQNDPFALADHMACIDMRRRRRITQYLATFRDSVALSERVLGEPFPYADCSIANCIYAGAFEIYDHDFGMVVERVGKLFNMFGETVTNSNENRCLVAIREDGLIMNSEAEIVESRANVRIHDIYIVERQLSNVEKTNLDRLPMAEKIRYLRRFSSPPMLGRRCIEAINDADVILYSPGTQHSSLYPTFMTRYIGEVIRSNREALKVFVANVGEDYETPAYTVSELVAGALRRLHGSDREEHSASSYIHYVLANNEFARADLLSKYIRHDPENVDRLGVQCISDRFEDHNNWGKHDGPKLVKTLFSLISRFDEN